jgi:hypothetical protein
MKKSINKGEIQANICMQPFVVRNIELQSSKRAESVQGCALIRFSDKISFIQ